MIITHTGTEIQFVIRIKVQRMQCCQCRCTCTNFINFTINPVYLIINVLFQFVKLVYINGICTLCAFCHIDNFVTAHIDIIFVDGNVTHLYTVIINGDFISNSYFIIYLYVIDFYTINIQILIQADIIIFFSGTVSVMFYEQITVFSTYIITTQCRFITNRTVICTARITTFR